MMTTEQRAVFNAAFQVGRALGRKFEASDLTPELRQAARLYAATYEGDFDFMLQFRQQCDGGVMFFSDGQTKGILNCLMADARRRMAAKPQAVTVPAASAPQTHKTLVNVPNGRYRVTLPSGDHLAIRLSDASADGKLAGSRIVSTRINGDEWMGVAHIAPQGDLRLWRSCAGQLRDRVRDAVNVLDGAETQDEWLVMGLAFAQAGSQCFICGRDLDTPESLTAGYGPVCADKHGLPWGAKAIPMSVRLAQAETQPSAPAECDVCGARLSDHDGVDCPKASPAAHAFQALPHAYEPRFCAVCQVREDLHPYTKEEEDEFMALANAPAAAPSAAPVDDYADNRTVNATMRAKKARGETLTYADIFPEDD